MTKSEGLAEMICSGGDERIQLSPETGMTEYGCQATPAGTLVELGSCTSSTLSRFAYDASTKLFERLSNAADSGERSRCLLIEKYGELRDSLLRQLGLGASGDVDIFLCPSGTDAEYLSTWLALGDQSTPLINIVIGPAEVGRGTAFASRGLHYGTRAPLGGAHCRPGTPLAGFPVEQIENLAIEIRDDHGRPFSVREIDEKTEAAVEEGIRQGNRVLVHLVAHSKTGIHAPSMSSLRSLKRRHQDRLMVAVDAAQGRCSFRLIRRWLEMGFPVLFTASKFYGGPAFSGALLVPRSQSLDELNCPPLSGGLASVVSRLDVPPRLHPFAEQLAHFSNPGLLLRWEAGIAEINRHQRFPVPVRSKVLEGLTSVLRDQLQGGGLDRLAGEELNEDPHDHFVDVEEHWVPSVISFGVTSAGGERLDRSQLMELLSELNRSRNGGRRFHLGQPAVLNPHAEKPFSVVRAAISAPMISELAEQVGPDCNPARLAQELAIFRDTIAELRGRLTELAGISG